MAILKTEILGSQIEINYEENDHEKLIILIDNFKKRLSEFPNNGRMSNNSIIFLTALKLEDELQIFKSLSNKNEIDEKKVEEQSIVIGELNKEIINLKHKLKDLDKISIDEKENKNLVIEKLDNVEKLFELIQKKLKDLI